jgi:5-methylcytosine-specific restriction enzyme A
MSRKQFIESQGATCKNWNWSWSFINKKEKVVIFGTWDIHKKGDMALILDESWERNDRGHRQPGYSQAIEHIRLVESAGFSLKTFQIIYSDERKDEEGRGPAKIEGFIPKLESKILKKVGSKWFAVG